MCALCEYIQELQAAGVDGGLEGDDIDRIFLPPLSVLAAWLFLRGGGPSYSSFIALRSSPCVAFKSSYTSKQ